MVDDGMLVAVDLGLRTGLAVYASDGRLRAYRSTNFGSRTRLRAGADACLRAHAPLAWLVAEGDATLAKVWGRAAARHGGRLLQVAPERWRAALLHPSERRSGTDAKHHAEHLARAVIDWSGAVKPVALRHDAAEAILVGLYGVVAVGWLPRLPAAVDPARRRNSR